MYAHSTGNMDYYKDQRALRSNQASLHQSTGNFYSYNMYKRNNLTLPINVGISKDTKQTKTNKQCREKKLKHTVQ